MKTRFKVFRYLIYIIEIFIFFIVEQTPGLVPKIIGQSPIFLIPILVTIALFEGEMAGLFFGIFIGILLDIGLWNIIGIYSITLGIVGFAIGHLVINFLKTNIFTSLLVGFIVVWLVYTICFVFTFSVQGYDGASYVFLNNYILRIFYTFAFTPVFYSLNKSIVLKIQAKE